MKTQDILLHYSKIYGIKHCLLKLAEEASELTQAALKLADAQELGKPITPEMLGDLSEEMAHTLIFMDAVAYRLVTPAELEINVNERLKRLIKKIMAKETKEFKARLILFDKPDELLPHHEVAEDGTVFAYLTPEEYYEQMDQLDQPWRDPSSRILGEFDNIYYDELHS